MNKLKWLAIILVASIAIYGCARNNQAAATQSSPSVIYDNSGNLVTKVGDKNSPYGAYEQVVMDELKSRYGLTEGQLATYPYKIYTGLDTALQTATDKALRDPSMYTNHVIHDNLDAGSATINIKTGLIAAVGGGRYYTPSDRPGDRVNGNLAYQQPGSAITPLLVYGPAIENGLKGAGQINKYTLLPDNKQTFGDWTPKNFDGTGYSNTPVTMDVALKESINVPAVWTLNSMVGLEDSFATAQNLDLPVMAFDKGLAPLSLGAFSKGVTPVQLARAYTVFPNGGNMIHAYTIAKVVDPSGKEIVPIVGKEEVTKPVFSPTTAWWMTDMMLDVTKSGTASKYALEGGRPFAGKTGSVAINTTAWFVGYTPSYVTSVVVFNTKLQDPNQAVLDLTGGTYPAHLFQAIMDGGLQGRPIEQFQKPGGVPDPQPKK